MSDTNRTKPDAANSNRQDGNRPDAASVPAAPATEAELEAIRYRGAPLLRAGPPAAANHNPISPIKPVGDKAETESIASEDITANAQKTPPRLA